MNLTDVKCKTNRYAVVGSSGYVGRPLADYLFGSLGLPVVRIDAFSKDKEYDRANIFFVAVPTPTVGRAFDGEIVEKTVDKTPAGSLIIIRSTVPADFVRRLAWDNNKTFVVVPEFLDADTATLNFLNPFRLVIGVDRPDTRDGQQLGQFVLGLLPGNTNKQKNYLMTIEEACFTKYASNAMMLLKNVIFNQFYDLATISGMDQKKVLDAISDDPRIGKAHTQIPHKGGRGAGGGCLVKDFEVFLTLMRRKVQSETDMKFLESASSLNRLNLKRSDKNLDILQRVFGE